MKKGIVIAAVALVALAAAPALWLLLDDGGSDDRRAGALAAPTLDCTRAKDPDLCAEGNRRLQALDSNLVVASERLRMAQTELAEIEEWQEKLNQVGDDAQLANVDLQNILQKQQQTLQMMSNISKMLFDTAQAVIRKIGG